MHKHLLLIAALVTAGSVSAQSVNPASGMVTAGIAADVGSTVVGLSMGLSEANPLGLALVPLKFMMKAHIDNMHGENERREASAQFTGVQFGAAAANVCTLAAAHPAVAALCFAAGAAWGYTTVKAIPTETDCVNRHIAQFEQAAAMGRVYRVVLKTCQGHLEPLPMLAKSESQAQELASISENGETASAAR